MRPAALAVAALPCALLLAGVAPPPRAFARGRHARPGPWSGHILEGEMTLLIDAQPPKVLKAGDSYQVPAGAQSRPPRQL